MLVVLLLLLLVVMLLLMVRRWVVVLLLLLLLSDLVLEIVGKILRDDCHRDECLGVAYEIDDLLVRSTANVFTVDLEL